MNFTSSFIAQLYAWLTFSSSKFSIEPWSRLQSRLWDCIKLLTFILSETEDVLDLLGRSVFSRRKLESSKLDPTPESEQEIQRDLLLVKIITIIPKYSYNFTLLGRSCRYCVDCCKKLVVLWAPTFVEETGSLTWQPCPVQSLVRPQSSNQIVWKKNKHL